MIKTLAKENRRSVQEMCFGISKRQSLTGLELSKASNSANPYLTFCKDFEQVQENKECTLFIDCNGVGEWALNNPDCVPKPDYIKYAESFCKKLGIQCVTTEISCKLAFDLIKKNICKPLLLSIQTYQNNCTLEAKTRIEEVCKQYGFGAENTDKGLVIEVQGTQYNIDTDFVKIK